MKDTFNVVSMNRRAWNRVADRYNSRQDEKIGVLFNAFLEALPVGAEFLMWAQVRGVLMLKS